MLPELAELPEISWNRMAAEIKANIRLGLEAGECVRGAEMPLRRGIDERMARGGGVCQRNRAGGRMHGAGASGARWRRTRRRSRFESTSDGIELQAGDEQMLGLMNGGAQKAAYTLDAQGSMGARYIDPETGSVTINTVYAQ